MEAGRDYTPASGHVLLFLLRGMATSFQKLNGSHIELMQDRGQIGNARLMGMQKDLHLSASQYYNALLVFCKHFKPRISQVSPTDSHPKSSVIWSSNCLAALV